jgi:3-deoxy-D-manno-octulosonic-acid transferase
MMYVIWRFIYSLLFLPIIVIGAYALVPFNRKLRRGLRGRRKTLRRVSRFRDRIYDRFGPLYWFHVASLGEYEQTRPVIEGLREIAPECIIAVSFFSPSGYEHFDHDAVDFKFYLPVDFTWIMRHLLRVLKPHKVVFTSYDIWPNLVWACKKARIPTTLFAARIVPGSSKQWPVLSNFYRNIYGAIGQIYTVSDPDHSRILAILGSNTKTEARNLGNPRYDRVKERNSREGTRQTGHKHRTIILGSVHNEDEDIIQISLLELLKDNSNLRVIWAPHEPDPPVIEAIGSLLSEAGIRWEHYSHQLGRFRDRQVLIVDGVGYLAELYSRGIISYVGGGFGSGVHNVMEAAIAGIPVIFGPRYNRSHEAEQLIEQGGGYTVSNREEFENAVKRFLDDETLRVKAGESALKVIEDNLGATARILQAILAN